MKLRLLTPAVGALWLLFTALALPGQGLAETQPEGAPCPAEFPTFYPSATSFEAALATTEDIAPWPHPVTGLTLPHHLVVPELIAGGYRLAINETPERILFLMPDHFRAATSRFATSSASYQTVLGPVPGDPAARGLIKPGLIEESCLFGKDHALRAHLPFLARLFPGVPVLPVAIGLGTTLNDWQALAAHLAPVTGPKTLIVQSTDFSHYLPDWQARQRDQEVLNLLAASDHAGLARLRQPEHIDSVGANWLQVVLQERHYRAKPLVLANRNQQDLTGEKLAETTSYMVVLYSPDRAPAPQQPFPGSNVYMLGGDLFLGRIWPRLVHDELIAERVLSAALAATGGLPLILNLEGSLLPEPPSTLPHLTLAMPSELLLTWAKRLNVVGLSLANNHSDDLGPEGRAETEATLKNAGIPFARQGERLDLPGVSLVALSDLQGGASPKADLLDAALLDRLILPDPSVPVLAFVHWGQEWATSPSPREIELARAMARRGAIGIIGAHSHAASAQPLVLDGGAALLVPSLGNFLFDQGAPASGALVEARSFQQGTVFLRQLALPNLFDLARQR